MKELRVCIVCPLYYPGIGGISRQAVYLTEALHKEGVKTFVITRGIGNVGDIESDIELVKIWSYGSREYSRIQVATISNLITSVTFSLNLTWRLFRRRRDYDIVHFHGASIPLLTNAPLLKLMGKKIVAKVSSSGLGIEAGSFKGRYSILGKIFMAILKRVDAFVAISSTIESALIDEGYKKERIHRISNFVDMTVFKSTAEKTLEETSNDADKKTVVFSGALIDTKGVDVLLRAWKQVCEVFEDARLLILGKGPAEEALKTLAIELNLNDSVEFAGEVEDVPERLQRADIGVLPSFHEGMPNSLLEAMGSGLPVVATRISGVIDVIEDGVNGFIVTPGSVEELATALMKLLKDELLLESMGKEAFNTIANNYSLTATTPKYISLYERLIS